MKIILAEGKIEYLVNIMSEPIGVSIGKWNLQYDDEKFCLDTDFFKKGMKVKLTLEVQNETK